MWRSYVGVTVRHAHHCDIPPLPSSAFFSITFDAFIPFIIHMLQVQTCIFTYEDKGCSNVLFSSDLLIRAIITSREDVFEMRWFSVWNRCKCAVKRTSQVFLQMKQERFVSSKRSRVCVKRQNAAGGVGNVISNVLKKRNGISRRAPRLLCTLEPGDYSML